MSTADTVGSEGDPIDVAVITQFFPPEGQGGGHRWQQFIQHHDEDELRYRVICPPPTYPYGEFERTYRPWQTDTVDGIPVTRLWTYQPDADAGGLARILNYGVFSVFATLYVLVNFWRYDCVVTMSTPHTTFLPGAVAKLLGRTWVVDIFDLWLDNAVDLGYVDEESFGYRFVAWLETLAMTRADHLSVLTPTMARYYQEKHDVRADRFTAIPFGVDEELFAPALDRDPEPRIIYVGNLGTFYAFEPYLRAFARLDEEYELYFVGWGECREELEELCAELSIEDRVTFTGRVPREEIPELLATSALNWVPLETDYRLDYARPTKLLEGMAVGVPYVASPLQEIDVITEQSNAGLTTQNKPTAIAEAMETILSDAELQQEMGQRAVEFIEQEHRWDVLSNRMRDVLLKVN